MVTFRQETYMDQREKSKMKKLLMIMSVIFLLFSIISASSACDIEYDQCCIECEIYLAEGELRNKEYMDCLDICYDEYVICRGGVALVHDEDIIISDSLIEDYGCFINSLEGE